jgi:hypothetical protein
MNAHKLLARLALLASLATTTFCCLAQQISIQPAEPKSRETIRLRVTILQPFALGRESVSMTGNRLSVIIRSFDDPPGSGPFPPGADLPATSGDIFLGKLPEGIYSVDVLFLNRVTSALSVVGNAQFVVADDLVARTASYPAYDFTDLWWNPAESGWGISIHVKREAFFAAWFVYDAVGKPTWYTLQGGKWESPNKYFGKIVATRSDPNAGLGPLSLVVVTEVGSGTMTFNSSDQATFLFSVDGKENTKNIIRQVF